MKVTFNLDELQAFIRELYADYAQVRWTLQYGMNNYKQPCARAGRELFIANYPIQARDASPQLALVFERNWSSLYSTAGASAGVSEALEE